MKLEEAKERLLGLSKVSEKGAKLHPDDAELFLTDKEALETVIAELHAMQNLLDEKNEEIEHLQKNNEELMNEYHKRVQERIDIEQELKDSISKDKIKCLILDKRKKIVENNIEIEECRKTIMEEQELKKLKLYTLHRKNDLLELEIADLFDLLKEE